MEPDLSRLPTRGHQGAFHVVVESPRGSTVKRGLRYPFDWGFIPSTKGPDGDPLDAMVLRVDPRNPGGKPGERQRNDRILAVPTAAPRYGPLRTYQDVSPRERDELACFFLAAVRFEDKDARILGWEGPEAVERMLTTQSSAGS